MMTVYKLTRQDMTTYNGFRYEVGVTARAAGDPAQWLCSNGYLHFYLSPEAAVFLNPIHASIDNPRLWRAVTEDVPVMDGTLKGGVRALTLVEEMVLPVLTTEQRVQVGIVCAWAAGSTSWRQWALGWLRGHDRSAAAAAAAWTAEAAARAAAEAARAAWHGGGGRRQRAAEAAAEAAVEAAVDIPAIFTQVLTETCAQTADRLEGGR